MTEKKCPLCKKSLSLQQINLTLAVYICDDLKCKYPVGFDCVVVERKLEDMNKNLDKGDLNDWINDIVANSDKSKDTTTDCTKEGTEWIDNLVEEAVNQARNETQTDKTGIDFDDILNFL